MRVVVRAQEPMTPFRRENAFTLCTRPVQRSIERVGRDLIDSIYDGSFCVGEGKEEHCWCGFDFNNIKLREEWTKRARDGWAAYLGRAKTDSRGTIFWLSKAPPVDIELVKRLNPHKLIPGELGGAEMRVPRTEGLGTTGDKPFLDTDIPVLLDKLDKAKAEVEKLKVETAGNCYLREVHDAGHLDARHVHIFCNRDHVSTPDRDIPTGALLDMVSDTVSRMLEP